MRGLLERLVRAVGRFGEDVRFAVSEPLLLAYAVCFTAALVCGLSTVVLLAKAATESCGCAAAPKGN